MREDNFANFQYSNPNLVTGRGTNKSPSPQHSCNMAMVLSSFRVFRNDDRQIDNRRNREVARKPHARCLVAFDDSESMVVPFVVVVVGS